MCEFLRFLHYQDVKLGEENPCSKFFCRFSTFNLISLYVKYGF